MKNEYDFSKGERGKFYKKNAEMILPIYLEPQIMSKINTIASKKKDVQAIVNNLLKHDLKIADSIN